VSRKRTRPPSTLGEAQSPAAPPAKRPGGARRAAMIVAVLLVFGVGAFFAWKFRNTSEHEGQAPGAARAASHVGSVACKQCHAAAFQAWQGSHHAQAMSEASERTVLGDFDAARHAYAGVTSTFSRSDATYVVETDGKDGKLGRFPVRYTFGVSPLQQYLIELPGGRLQALSIAWDTRAPEAGGQRWFHLYPGQRIGHADPLHWTGLQQNWNFMCADCHSTALRKNYDAAAGEFHTRWSEISVGCEACHGPASNHLAWARKEGDWTRFAGSGKGFSLSYDERAGVTWSMQAESGIAQRNRPRESAKEITACAQCHARRAQISEDYGPGRPIGDGYLISLLEDGLYWRDGQMRDEVFNHGSFLQSRMHAKGVTCSDCHEPHSGRLRAQGNAVCTQCHASAKFDASSHHHHPTDSAGARCVACHMPPTTYMVVDPRHDHSMRIPRPDLSVKIGTPNACTTCHADRKPTWAAQAMRSWYGRASAGYQTFAEAFDAADRYAAGASAALLSLVHDRDQPAIVRASALTRLARDPSPPAMEAAVDALNDSDELVRRAGVEMLAAAEPSMRLRYLPRVVDDPVRAVRIAAARALASVPDSELPEDRRAVRARAMDEYIAAQRYNADRPEAHLNLGALHQARGEFEQAEAAYRKALALYPNAPQALINLADLHRARGNEAEAEALLIEGVRTHPASASLHHALGLSYARQKKGRLALEQLSAAARLGQDDPAYAYVYGVALHSYGDPARAIAVLERAHQRFTGSRSVLQALASMEHERGNDAKALVYAQKMVDVAPGDREAQALLRALAR